MMLSLNVPRLPGLIRALFQDAIDNMRSVPLRSLLSLLGIVIGSAAVVALLSIGESTAEEAVKQFRSMGTDLIVIQDGPSFGSQRKTRNLVVEDASNLKGRISRLSHVAPISSSAVKTSLGSKMLDAMVVGCTEDLLTVANLQVDQGRFVSYEDGYSTIVVVGSKLAEMLAGTGVKLKIGDMIRVDNYRYRVVGVLQSTSRNPLLPFDFDNALIVPIKSERRFVLSTGTLSNILVRVAKGSDPIVAMNDILAYLQGNGSAAQVQGALQLIDGMKQQGKMFKWMLGGVASIALLVGGIGVMNVMLAGVSERKIEIGLRMAIGADRMSIMLMMVAEAALLTMVGGSIGTMLGLGFSFLFSWFSGWDPSLSGLAALIGFGMSLATGLFFGTYPAILASKMTPIEALRAR